MKIPEECIMADISDIKESLIPAMILKVITGLLTNDKKLEEYYKVYIFLLDKAIGEYADARNILLKQVDIFISNTTNDQLQWQRFFYGFDYSYHMENCINAIRRLLLIFCKIKRSKNIKKDKKRQLCEQISRLKDNINNFRHALEHIDERIKNDEINENGSIIISVKDDYKGICIANENLSFVELERIIRRLYEFAKNFILIN